MSNEKTTDLADLTDSLFSGTFVPKSVMDSGAETIHEVRFTR